MESVAASIPSSSASSSPFSVFSPKRDRAFPHRRRSLLPIAANSNEDEADLHPDSQIESTDPIPPLSNRLSIRPLSKDAAMGLVLGAATGRGWTTPSGMEGPSAPAAAVPAVSTFPWSLFTNSPRRRMRVAFTCNLCGQRTTRAINPHAYTDGTVFVQCCGCNVFHKLVDNLNLFHDMKCYVNPSFRYKGYEPFDYLDSDGGDDDIFPLF